MKKIIYLLMIIPIAFASCEKENLSSQIEMDAIAAKAKISKENSEEESCSEGGTTETAFGRACTCPTLNTCFIDTVPGFNRWGWSVKLVGYDSGYFTLFAGVGQCDMTKGTPVGKIHVNYDEDGVTYGDFEPIPGSGFSLKEFHFYAGDTEVPMGKNGKPTVAPGQFYNEGDVNGDETVYVILHAVVCGDFEE